MFNRASDVDQNHDRNQSTIKKIQNQKIQTEPNTENLVTSWETKPMIKFLSLLIQRKKRTTKY